MITQIDAYISGHGPAPRQVLTIEDEDGVCRSHLIWFTKTLAGSKDQFLNYGPPRAAGLVDDMLTRESDRGTGLLRQLVERARALAPGIPAPYCLDDSLTVDGAKVAVSLGLIEQVDHTRTDRPAYADLKGRGSGHLAHPPR